MAKTIMRDTITCALTLSGMGCVIWLASIANIEGAVVVCVAAIAFVLVLNIDRLKRLSLFGLKAELAEATSNARDAATHAETASELASLAALHLLTYAGRLYGEDARQEAYSLAKEVIASVPTNRRSPAFTNAMLKLQQLIRWDHIVEMRGQLRGRHPESELASILKIEFDDQLPSTELVRKCARDVGMEQDLDSLLQQYQKALASDFPDHLCRHQ